MARPFSTAETMEPRRTVRRSQGVYRCFLGFVGCPQSQKPEGKRWEMMGNGSMRLKIGSWLNHVEASTTSNFMGLHLGFDGIRSTWKELRRWLVIILPLRKGAGKHTMSKTTRIRVCRFLDYCVQQKETFTVNDIPLKHLHLVRGCCYV